MKKQNRKSRSIQESRRRFIAYFSSIGLGATLVPGILWGRMQETGAQTITLEMLTTSLKLGGVEFSEDERKQMVTTANQNLTRARKPFRLFTSRMMFRRRSTSMRSFRE